MISLVLTVKNERDNIEDWLLSIEKQEKQPDEIVIVDGGSNDGTWEYLIEKTNQSKILKVIQKDGNIAVGRNAGIKEAKGDLIVVTDAGCTYDPNWFGKISSAVMTAGFSATAFAPWFKAEDSFLVYAIAAVTMPRKEEFKKNWLPSSRSVAFRKDMWQTVGGYPEWIPFCEDVLFDKELIKSFKFPAYIREPLVYWRPRTTVTKYLRQLFNYTLSEGHARINLDRNFIRFFVYSLSIGLLATGLWWVVMLGVFVYSWKYWLRWNEFVERKNVLFKIKGTLLIPILIAIGDLAKMSGFLNGLVERLNKKIIPKVYR